MINQAFAKILADMASILEIQQDNPFRIRAYQRAVQAVLEYSDDLGTMSEKQLLEIPGIGKGIAEKILEFAEAGRVKEHDAMMKKFPAGLLELLRVPGLGPRRARFLFEELKIDSPAKLKAAAAKGKLRDLKGFGEKLEENILKGLQAIDGGGGKRLLLWDA